VSSAATDNDDLIPEVGPAGHASPRRRLARADRERQVLAVAHQQFASRGYAEVTMEDIAHAVGVTKPLLYAYFGNKERLYEACMAPAGEALIGAILAEVAKAERTSDALALGVRAFFAFVDDDRDAWRVLFDETLPSGGAIAQRAGEYREHLVSLVQQTLLEILPEELRPRAAAQVEALSVSLMAAAEALARWWLRTDAMTAAQAADLLIAAVEPGLLGLAEAEGSTKENKD
jgi:AcrR family transcriptional regulator